MPSPLLAIGIDFGTTNSSVALARTSAPGQKPQVKFLQFQNLDGVATAATRSILYIEKHTRGPQRIVSFTGRTAVERYLNRHHPPDDSTESDARPGRLIQPLKSYLAVRNLTGTEVFGRRLSVEDLIARILTDIRLAAEREFKTELGDDPQIIVGRPIRFVSAESPEDDALAVSRLQTALASAGLSNVTLLPEPVAAGLAYGSALKRDELILIGDFGGGTSDFSLLRVGPSARSLTPEQRVIGVAGVGLAGDAFDAKLVRHLVSPALGSDSLAQSLGKTLPAVPAWIYTNLERWHYLSFLRTRNVDEILRTARMCAFEPEKIEALITLIDEDLGYQLHQAVQRTKVVLSERDDAEFVFQESGLDLRRSVTRSEFELWIAAELEQIRQAIERLLSETKVQPEQVDRIFLTGGTSFVPAVRRVFEARFDPARIVVGEAFTSVAHGLALHALKLSMNLK